MHSSKVEGLGDRAHEVATAAADYTKVAINSGREMLDTTIDGISDRVDQVRRSSAPVVKRAKRRTRALLDQSGEILSDVSDRAIETATDISKGLVSYTKKNPITALLLALGAGALLVSVVGAAKSIHSQR
jgi:hypothetical protein